MNMVELDLQQLHLVANGNNDAFEFLKAWKNYAHGIDDIVDGDNRDPQFIIGVFMQAAFLYSNVFYLSNIQALRQQVINITNAYADTVSCAQDSTGWKRSWADVYRHVGMEMLLAVASITGGYLHMRSISMMLREACYNEHHNAKGEAQ